MFTIETTQTQTTIKTDDKAEFKSAYKTYKALSAASNQKTYFDLANMEITICHYERDSNELGGLEASTNYTLGNVVYVSMAKAFGLLFLTATVTNESAKAIQITNKFGSIWLPKSAITADGSIKDWFIRNISKSQKDTFYTMSKYMSI